MLSLAQQRQLLLGEPRPDCASAATPDPTCVRKTRQGEGFPSCPAFSPHTPVELRPLVHLHRFWPPLAHHSPPQHTYLVLVGSEGRWHVVLPLEHLFSSV